MATPTIANTLYKQTKVPNTGIYMYVIITVYNNYNWLHRALTVHVYTCTYMYVYVVIFMYMYIAFCKHVLCTCISYI